MGKVKKLTLDDVKSALGLATPSTRKLVTEGIKGSDEFPELLAKYKWFGTRDYNVALIVIALFSYCAKKNVQVDLSNLKKGLECMCSGKGPSAAANLRNPISDALNEIVEESSKLVDTICVRIAKITRFIPQNEKILRELSDDLLSKSGTPKVESKVAEKTENDSKSDDAGSKSAILERIKEQGMRIDGSVKMNITAAKKMEGNSKSGDSRSKADIIKSLKARGIRIDGSK